MIKKLLAAAVCAAVLTSGAAEAAIGYDAQRHWAADVITTFSEYGVIETNEKERFRPDDYITRADAADIYVKFLGKIGAEGLVLEGGVQEDLPEVGSDDSRKENIGIAKKYGMLIADEDGIRPYTWLTREEFAHMLYIYTGRKYPDASAENWYPDIQDSFACTEIEKLCTLGIMSGDGDGNFYPGRYITRADFLCTLYTLADGWTKKQTQITLPKSNVIDVPYISQVWPVNAPVGCEATSLLMGLKGKGYAKDVDLRTFLDNMPKTESNPAKGFVGSPYVADRTKKTRTTIYPEALAEYGRQYGECESMSGSSPVMIQAELLAGNPVVAYETLWWEKPFYRWYNIEGEMQRLLSNNHALLLIGYDSETDYYYIADPYNLKDKTHEYKYWKSADIVNDIYNARRHAVVVR